MTRLTSSLTDSLLVHLGPKTLMATSCTFFGYLLRNTSSNTMGSYITKVHGISRTITTWCRAHPHAFRCSPLHSSTIARRRTARSCPKSDGRRPTKCMFADKLSKVLRFNYQYSSSTMTVTLGSGCQTYLKTSITISITRMRLHHSEAGPLLTSGST